jgi:hypothetical protein
VACYPPEKEASREVKNHVTNLAVPVPTPLKQKNAPQTFGKALFIKKYSPTVLSPVQVRSVRVHLISSQVGLSTGHLLKGRTPMLIT